MRSRSRTALAVVLPVLSLALTGCFELKEEIWFNKDGTGRLKVTLGMDQKMHDEQSAAKKKKDEEKTKKQKEEIEKNANVSKCEISTKSENGMYYETTDISLKDFSKLPETLKEFQQRDPQSEDVMTLKKLDDGSYEFFQTFGKKTKPKDQPEPSAEDKKRDAEMQAQFAKQLGEHKLTVVVHGTGIGETNGKSDGTSATFEHKLADLMTDQSGKGVEMKAVVKMK
jgi:hypothetical protein